MVFYARGGEDRDAIVAGLAARRGLADYDPRCTGRTIHVDSIDGDKAVCTVLTNSDATQRDLDAYTKPGRNPSGPILRDTRGKVGRISLSRFRPTCTGYTTSTASTLSTRPPGTPRRPGCKA
ncbi:hypothetical protein ACFOY2_06500 [Nonomuraea purpurea]|uniref:Uncharacterized protein n=1 Tax=Nonomuraea purpurea TaxID=1849276 RepID=A0ABV8G2G7_9ACTN